MTGGGLVSNPSPNPASRYFPALAQCRNHPVRRCLRRCRARPNEPSFETAPSPPVRSGQPTECHSPVRNPGIEYLASVAYTYRIGTVAVGPRLSPRKLRGIAGGVCDGSSVSQPPALYSGDHAGAVDGRPPSANGLIGQSHPRPFSVDGKPLKKIAGFAMQFREFLSRSGMLMRRGWRRGFLFQREFRDQGSGSSGGLDCPACGENLFPEDGYDRIDWLDRELYYVL